MYLQKGVAHDLSTLTYVIALLVGLCNMMQLFLGLLGRN